MELKSVLQWVITSGQLEWLSYRKQELTRVSEDSASCALLIRKYIGVVTMDNSMKIPQAIKNRATIYSSNPTSRYTVDHWTVLELGVPTPLQLKIPLYTVVYHSSRFDI